MRQILRIFTKFPITQLSNSLKFPFSLSTSLKPLSPQTISRHHSRIRVDEYKNTFITEQQIEQFIQTEQQTFTKYTKQCKQRIDEYFRKAHDRKNNRTETTPEKIGQFQYMTTANWHKDREYSLIYRIGAKRNLLVLDIMKHWPLYNYWKTIQLHKTVFSDSHKYLAFGVDLDNSEKISFMIKDISKNQIVAVKNWENNMLRNVDNIVFYKDQAIFYVKVNKNHRPHEVWYLDLASGNQKLIHSQKDEGFYLDIAKSKDQSKLIITSNGKQSNKVWVIDLQKGTQNLFKLHHIFLDKQQKSKVKNINNEEHKLNVNHCGQFYVIWKNGLLDGDQILALGDVDGEEKLLCKVKPEQSISDIDVFEKYVVLYMKAAVSPKLKVISLADNKATDIQLPFIIGDVSPGGNQQFKTTKAFVYFNNIFVYNEGYQLNLQTLKLVLKQKFEMTGPKFNPKNYEVQIHQVPSESGQLIPLTTIIPKRNKGRPNKMLLHSYGYYGINYEISFNSTYWAALQMGWSLGYAHIRGGGEKGMKWHLAARKQKRAYSWKDLEDCVAYLIMHQYTHPSILILMSHSAGAITIWNAINRNPHLYKAALFSYPFLDILGSLLDKDKALSQTDYHQFGNPIESAQFYNQIESYSPYETIQPNKDYPFILITAGRNDYRCPVEQVAKFTSRYRKIARSGIPKNMFEEQNTKNVRRMDSNLNYREKQYFEDEQYQKVSAQELKETQKMKELKKYSFSGQKQSVNGLLLKINDEASHEGIADVTEQIYDGCEKLGILDYLIEQASYDITIDTGKNIKKIY